MRKLLLILIPVITLAIFLMIMFSGDLLKYSKVEGRDMPEAIKNLEGHILSEDWDSAHKSLEDMEKLWSKLEKRIQFSEERDEMNYINVCISRIKGALTTRDKKTAIIELNEVHEHWDNLGS